MSDRPTVTIAIPVLNEEAHLGACLGSIRAQTWDRIVQVLVVDGGSADRTLDIAAAYPEVTVVANPRRTQACGLNVALAAATGDVFVRADGHCELAPDYVERCVDALEATGAALVGGAMSPRASSWLGRGVVGAMTSPFGAGPARFHVGGEDGWVETVYLGAGRTELYRELGGYATDVGVNEDTELAHRARGAGGVWFTSAVRSTYTPRDSLRAVARQFFRYGLSRAATTRRHPQSLRLRQLFPPAFLAALVLSPRRRQVLGAYGAAVAVAAARFAREDPAAVPAFVVVLPTMHLTWGAGFLAGIGGWPPPGSVR